jgi:FAD/FMN-containing dehydrogenase
LERKHGLACDNLLAAELVTAGGDIVRASDDENPDLLWALRGGGGNFGIVTSFEFRLHPLGPEVLAGLVLYPVEAARVALRLFRDLMLAAPDELGLAFAYITAPAEPGVPLELQGRQAVMIAGLYCGPVAAGEQALYDLRSFGPPAADFFEVTRYADFQRSLDDPPGYRNYWTAENVAELSDDAIDTIATRSEQIPPGPSQLFIVPWGGAVARVTAETSPLGGRDARFVIHPLLLWQDPADDDSMIELGRGYRDVLRPYATGSTYLNFLGDEGKDRVRAGFVDGAYEQLAALKARWDPANELHGSQNLRGPATAGRVAPEATGRRTIEVSSSPTNRSD